MPFPLDSKKKKRGKIKWPLKIQNWVLDRQVKSAYKHFCQKSKRNLQKLKKLLSLVLFPLFSVCKIKLQQNNQTINDLQQTITMQSASYQNLLQISQRQEIAYNKSVKQLQILEQRVKFWKTIVIIGIPITAIATTAVVFMIRR